MFGVFEKINFRALPEYLGNQLNNLNVFVFSDDGQSGFKVKVSNFFSGINTALAEVWREIAQLWRAVSGARTALVFDTTQQLDDWIHGRYQRPDGITVNDIAVGTLLLTRLATDPNYWWDGTYIQLYDESQINLDDYLSRSLDLVQDVSTPANPNKVVSQAGIWNWAGRLVSSLKWNSQNTSWELWQADDTSSQAPENRVAKFSLSETWVGMWAAFRATQGARYIRFASQTIRDAFVVTTNSWRLNYLNGNKAIELENNNNLSFRQHSNGQLDFINRNEIKIFGLTAQGEMKIYHSGGTEVFDVEPNGTVALRAGTYSTSAPLFFYTQDGNGRIGRRNISDFATQEQINTLMGLIQGGQTALVFDDLAQFNAWLDGTYERPDGQEPSVLQIGTIILTRDPNESDYWWDGSAIQLRSQTLVTDDFLSRTNDVVQTTGSATDKVMSQKAVTDALDAISSGGGGGSSVNIIQTNYQALLTLQQANQLVPAQKYQFEYTCIYMDRGLNTGTATGDTKFNIIITAISNSEFSQDVDILEHPDWTVRYDFTQNNTYRRWARTTDMGQITYLKDEFGNEAPYDFKNIKTTFYLLNLSRAAGSAMSRAFLMPNLSYTIASVGCTLGATTTQGVSYNFDNGKMNITPDFTKSKALYLFDNGTGVDMSLTRRVANNVVRFPSTANLAGSNARLELPAISLCISPTGTNMCQDNTFIGCERVLIQANQITGNHFINVRAFIVGEVNASTLVQTISNTFRGNTAFGATVNNVFLRNANVECADFVRCDSSYFDSSINTGRNVIDAINSMVTGQIQGSTMSLRETYINGAVTQSNLQRMDVAFFSQPLFYANISEVNISYLSGINKSNIKDLEDVAFNGQIMSCEIGNIENTRITGQIVNSNIREITQSTINGQISSSTIVDMEQVTVGSIFQSIINDLTYSTINGEIRLSKILELTYGTVAGSIQWSTLTECDSFTCGEIRNCSDLRLTGATCGTNAISQCVSFEIDATTVNGVISECSGVIEQSNVGALQRVRGRLGSITGGGAITRCSFEYLYGVNTAGFEMRNCHAKNQNGGWTLTDMLENCSLGVGNFANIQIGGKKITVEDNALRSGDIPLDFPEVMQDMIFATLYRENDILKCKETGTGSIIAVDRILDENDSMETGVNIAYISEINGGTLTRVFANGSPNVILPLRSDVQYLAKNMSQNQNYSAGMYVWAAPPVSMLIPLATFN